MYADVLKVQNASLGDLHYDTLTTTASLARTVASAGDLERALKLLNESLVKHQKVLGVVHPDTISLVDDVYFVLYELDRHDEAEDLLRLSLSQRREELGMDTAVTLETASDLGAFLHMRGKVAEAEAILEDTLARQKIHIGDLDKNTLATMSRLGAVYLSIRHLKKAREILEQAHESQSMTLGAEHPLTLSTQQKLAMLLTEEGNFEEAEKIYRDIYERKRSTFGKKREHRVMLALKDLIESMMLTGKEEDAITLQRELLEDLLSVYGADHVLSLAEKQSLGVKLHQKGEFKEADVFIQAAYDGKKRILGDSNVETQRALALLANNRMKLGDINHAEVMYRVALDGLRRNMSSDSPEFLGLMLNFATLLNSKENHMEALSFAQEAYQGFLKTLGPSHEYTVTSLGPYTESLANSGMPGAIYEALALLKHSREETAKELGETHSLVVQTEGAIKELTRLIGGGDADQVSANT